jgi:hypothetical protein
MLIEQTGGPPDAGAGAGRSPPAKNESQRWLAQLEREFLQANESLAQQHTQQDGAKGGETTGRGHRVVHRGPGQQSDSAGEGSSSTGLSTPAQANPQAAAHAHSPPAASADAAARHAENSLVQARSAAASPASQASITSAAGLVLPAGALPVARLGLGAATSQPLAPPPLSLASASSQLDAQPLQAIAPASLESIAPQGRESAAVADRRPSGPAPNYAKQLMSLTEGEHPAATIRDAALRPADFESVAHSVSLQLQASGFAVQRIFINGQRFDITPAGTASVPRRHSQPFQDDDA